MLNWPKGMDDFKSEKSIRMGIGADIMRRALVFSGEWWVGMGLLDGSTERRFCALGTPY